MSIQTMHPTLSAYVEAANLQDVDRQVACFLPDAVVADEGETHTGSEEIRAWILKSQAAYEFKLEPIEVREEADRITLTCKVTGTFDGSPITLRFLFTMRGEKIAALSIGD